MNIEAITCTVRLRKPRGTFGTRTMDEKAYGFYKSAMEKAGILIISDQEIKK